ncbi:hypothetical protein K491DRAFT_419831 [Lophiostoma macrostomum CBS 122681]|uniref:Uncharacterized protein n=1 Tax=Lophiostoma macrostomum CBS 122681 TaxID=1314788 RepID=A0A6A6TQ88_9PLEO|nr:hypothetical protein K491DRAFT_419831 [Lophiostoma macrostomum CBS 122681]
MVKTWGSFSFCYQVFGRLFMDIAQGVPVGNASFLLNGFYCVVWCVVCVKCLCGPTVCLGCMFVIPVLDVPRHLMEGLKRWNLGRLLPARTFEIRSIIFFSIVAVMIILWTLGPTFSFASRLFHSDNASPRNPYSAQP